MINFQKSEIFFNKNTPSNVKDNISSLLCVSECLGLGNYLGMPSMIGKKKKAIFNYMRDKIWKKINHWSGKHLSKVRREMLIMSMAQAIPSYCRSTFLLPSTLEEETQRMLNSF